MTRYVTIENDGIKSIDGANIIALEARVVALEAFHAPPPALDKNNKGLGLVLSNGDLTATKLASGYSSVTTETKQNSSSNVVFEATWDSTSSSSHSFIIGVVSDATHTDANVLDGALFDASGNGFYGFLFADGHHSIDGVRTNGVFPVQAIGTIFQLRMSSNLLEAIVNNIVIDSVPIPTGEYYGLLNLFNSAGTINLGATAFSNTLSVGFSSWDGSQTG